MLEWPLTHWEDVIFSDESRFCLHDDSGVFRVWRTTSEADNPKYFRPTFVNTASVMVWGCIGPSGVGKLAVCERPINSAYYQEILRENLKKSVKMIYGNKQSPFIFQQDNAPSHSSIATKQYFKRKGILVLPWPSQSPDLNIIENVWQNMKNALNKDIPRTKAELVEKIFKIWYSIPPEFISKLYASIPKRLRAVAKNGGYATKF